MIKMSCDFCGKRIDYDIFHLRGSLGYQQLGIERDTEYCGSAIPDLCDACKSEIAQFINKERSKYNQAISDYIDSKRKAYNEKV